MNAQNIAGYSELIVSENLLLIYEKFLTSSCGTLFIDFNLRGLYLDFLINVRRLRLLVSYFNQDFTRVYTTRIVLDNKFKAIFWHSDLIQGEYHSFI